MRRILFLLAALCLALTAFAQTPPAPPQLTWIRYYEATPGHEMELTKLLADSSKPVFDKLIADKKVIGWGIAIPMSHTGEPWTHVAYVALADWSAVEAMSSAFEAVDAKMSAADLKKMDEQFMAALKPNAMRDVVIRHLVQGGPSNMTKPKYIGVDTYVIKPGRFEDAVGLFNEWAKPTFGDVAAKGGKVGPWGLSVQEMVTTPGWTHMIWYFMNDLTAIDEMNAADMALGPMKLKGYDVRLRDMSEPEKHQGQILRIVYQQ
jgi:hypothetical protein